MTNPPLTHQPTGFLAICAPVVLTGPQTGRAELDLNRFAGLTGIDPAFALIEGMNQVAVRLAMKIHPKGTMRRFLPVSFKRLALRGPVAPSRYLSEGAAELAGDSARITVSVRSNQEACSMLAEAEILVSTLPGGTAPSAEAPRAASGPDAAAAAPILAVSEALGPLTLSLSASVEHPIYPEHFPGFAVVPASLVLETLCGQAARALGRPNPVPVTISDTRFLRPLRPGQSYLCKPATRSGTCGTGRLSFVINDTEGAPCVRGAIAFPDITDTSKE